MVKKQLDFLSNNYRRDDGSCFYAIHYVNERLYNQKAPIRFGQSFYHLEVHKKNYGRVKIHYSELNTLSHKSLKFLNKCLFTLIHELRMMSEEIQKGEVLKENKKTQHKNEFIEGLIK